MTRTQRAIVTRARLLAAPAYQALVVLPEESVGLGRSYGHLS